MTPWKSKLNLPSKSSLLSLRERFLHNVFLLGRVSPIFSTELMQLYYFWFQHNFVMADGIQLPLDCTRLIVYMRSVSLYMRSTTSLYPDQAGWILARSVLWFCPPIYMLTFTPQLFGHYLSQKMLPLFFGLEFRQSEYRTSISWGLIG